MTVKLHWKIACGMGATWIAILIAMAFLTGCAATPDTTYIPVNVNTPVAVPCHVPDVDKPPDLIAPLKPGATLTTGMKALIAQHDYDEGYIGQLEAALAACK